MKPFRTVTIPLKVFNYFIQDSLRVFIEDLQAQSKGLKIVSFLFGGVGIFIIGFGLWRYWKNRENRRQSEENFRRLEQVNSLTIFDRLGFHDIGQICLQ